MAHLGGRLIRDHGGFFAERALRALAGMQLRASVLTLVCLAAGVATAALTPPGPAQRAELFALVVFALLAGLASAARRVAPKGATQSG